MKFAVVAAVLAGLTLSGCVTTTQVVTSPQLMVVDIPEVLYQCPVINKFPEWKTLTDRQVANLIVQLQRNNITCATSLKKIREFVKRAKATIG